MPGPPTSAEDTAVSHESSGCSPEAGSFRDPNSRVCYRDGAVYRLLTPEALDEWERLTATRFFERFTAEGHLVGTRRLAEPAAASLLHDLAPSLVPTCAAVLQHDRIPLISYPFEWSFGMLQDAALLQLDLLLAALDEGMCLKDATPYNIQWQGSRPVFIDIPSFVRLPRGEPWVGYRQFCRLFLYPLMLQAYRKVPFQPWLRGNLSGIEPQHLWRMLSAFDLLRPGVFKHVYLSALVENHLGDPGSGVRESFRVAGFHHDMIKGNARNLRRLIQGLRPASTRSHWSGYAEQSGYSHQDMERKQAFVRAVVARQRWSMVYDLGSNTGVYSRLAAENADYVVAMDSDHASMERLYRSLRAGGGTRILPLVVNAVDPTPSMGWQHSELKPLDARGRPDLVLCLALVHHLVLGENVPLRELVRQVGTPGSTLIIEFPTMEDPRVLQYIRERPGHHPDYQRDTFERYLAESHAIVSTEVLSSGTRVLYHAQSLS